MERFTLRPAEKVLVHVRRHPVMIAVPLVFLFALLLLDAFFMAQLFRAGVVGSVVFAGIAAFVSVSALRTWLLWVSNVFLVTSHRVIDVDRHGFFDWTISEADLDRIQDVSVHKRGIMDHVFRTGTIEIQTAGSSAMLELSRIPQPFALRARITEAQDALAVHAPAAEPASDLIARINALPAEERRAVAKYVEHLRSRRAFQEFAAEPETDA